MSKACRVPAAPTTSIQPSQDRRKTGQAGSVSLRSTSTHSRRRTGKHQAACLRLMQKGGHGRRHRRLARDQPRRHLADLRSPWSSSHRRGGFARATSSYVRANASFICGSAGRCAGAEQPNPAQRRQHRVGRRARLDVTIERHRWSAEMASERVPELRARMWQISWYSRKHLAKFTISANS